MSPIAAVTPRFAPPDRLAGRYRVERLLGRGGMCEVYAATDEELAIQVAVKTLAPALAADRTALARLKREVLLARSIGHANVCRVYDLGWHGENSSRVWFVTMELLHGESLRDRLNGCTRFLTTDALPLAEHIAAALGAAHRSGVVHRDLKSGNVMLVSDGEAERAVVTDFGLARAASDPLEPTPGWKQGAAVRAGADPRLTDDDFIVGTPAYMAPEQVMGEAVGPPADIYALGVVLFEMVTGTLPWEGGLAESLARRLDHDPPSPRERAPELPEHWEAAILRCMARNPESRFARAEEVAEALAGRTAEVARVSRAGRPALPAERDAFIGREAELAELDRAIASRPGLVTLLGIGGMGKTRLAVRCAWRGVEHDLWPGGVWFCDLTEARDVDGVASAVAASLGVPLGKGNPIEQLGHVLAARGRCLVILDNFEQVVGAAEDTVGRWLTRAGDASIVVTSRERLHLPDETIHAIGPMTPEAGFDLFVERARRQRPALELEGQELEAAREVVRLADGMPLAIELAAARMRVMTAGELVRRMRERFRLLGGGTPGRHATLEAVFDESWELLQPWERAALSDAAVFEGGFTLEAAEAVIDLAPWPDAPWVVDVVQSLVDKSLLRMWVPPTRIEARVAEARFGMYVSVQEYARAKGRERIGSPETRWPPGERTVQSRHGEWFARLGTDEALDALDGPDGIWRREVVERDYENLVAACRRAIARGDGPVATSTFCALRAIVELRGPISVGLDLGRQLLAMNLETPHRTRALASTAVLTWRAGNVDEGRSLHEAALELAVRIGDRRGQGIALAAIGALDWLGGRSDEAGRKYDEALARLRDAGDRRVTPVVLSNVGNLHRHAGRMEAARTAYENALAMHRELHDARGEARVLGNLGNLEHDLGRFDEAQRHYEASLDLNRRVGDRRSEAVTLLNLGNLLHDLGRDEEMCRHHEAALAIFQDVGEQRGVGVVGCNLGSVQLERGNLVEARRLLEQAITTLRAVADRRTEGVALGNLGRVELAEGRLEAARETIAIGEAVLRETNDKLQLGKLLCARAALEHARADTPAARATLAEAESLAADVAAQSDSELCHEIEWARAQIEGRMSGPTLCRGGESKRA